MSTMKANALSSTMLQARLHDISAQLGYFDYVVLVLLLLAGVSVAGKGKLWQKQDPYYYKFFERPQLLAEEPVSINKQTRDITKLLEEEDADVAVLWASQSGTAEGFARRLARDFYQRLRLKALVVDIDDFEHDSLCHLPRSKLAVFVVSTYGEGEPSDNGVAFLKWVQTTTMSLTNVQYSAFGLGNSNYRLYNQALFEFAEAMGKRGAFVYAEIGKGDEAKHGTEEGFAERKNQLLSTTASLLGLPEHDPIYEPAIQITDLNISEDDSSLKQRFQTIKYKTGDHLAVWPTNPEVEVARIISVLGLQNRQDFIVQITPRDSNNNKSKLPEITTLKTLFKNHLEISGPLSRELLSTLMQFAPNDAVKSFLKVLSSDKAAFASFNAQNHMTLARILEYTQQLDQSISWSHVPLTFVIEALQPMSPRYYSISSSSIISPRRIAITVSVKPTPLTSNPPVTIPGLTSTYLSTVHPLSLAIADTSSITPSLLTCQIRPSKFKLPASPATPIIMVAAGTGVAPFRAFIQQRARIASNSTNPVGEAILFFGCQNHNTDFLYQDELESIRNNAHVHAKMDLDIITAFSRPHDSQKKMYVQHRVAEHSKRLAELLLEQDAALYICGAVTMAKAVGQEVEKAVLQAKKEAEWDAERYASWRTERKKARRWCEDVWG